MAEADPKKPQDASAAPPAATAAPGGKDPASAAVSDAAADAKKSGKKEKGPGFFASRTPRELLILKVAAFVITLVLLDLLTMQPANRYLNKLNEEIKVEEKIIPKRLAILQYKDRIVSDYKALKPYFTDPAIGQEEEIARLLREIERVSKEANLFVSNINPVKVDKISETVYELSLDIEGRGGISQIRQFMRSLESLNPPIRIKGFSLRPQSKDSDDLKCSFTIVKLGVKEKDLSTLNLA